MFALAGWSRAVVAVGASLSMARAALGVERAEMLMGTVAQVEECTPGTAMEGAVEDAFLRMRQIDRTFTLYREGSELRRFNASAGSGWPVALGEDLYQVLRRADEVSRATHGAFDVTVLPLLLARGGYGGLGLDAGGRGRLRIGFFALLLDPSARAGRFLMPGMGVDLGAIGKGYAVDAAVALLQARASRCGLLDLGGTVRVWGEARRSWRIGVRDPAAPASLLGLIELQRGAVATSGNYFRPGFGEGDAAVHIFDPRTRKPALEVRAVTVWAGDATIADALSTALFVLGPERGRKILASRFPGATALFVREGRKRQTQSVFGHRPEAWHPLVGERRVAREKSAKALRCSPKNAIGRR